MGARPATPQRLHRSLASRGAGSVRVPPARLAAEAARGASPQPLSQCEFMYIAPPTQLVRSSYAQGFMLSAPMPKKPLA